MRNIMARCSRVRSRSRWARSSCLRCIKARKYGGGGVGATGGKNSRAKSSRFTSNRLRISSTRSNRARISEARRIRLWNRLVEEQQGKNEKGVEQQGEK